MNCRYAAALIVAIFVAELYLRPRGYNWRERTRGSTHTHTHTDTHTLKSPPVSDFGVIKGEGGRTAPWPRLEPSRGGKRGKGETEGEQTGGAQRAARRHLSGAVFYPRGPRALRPLPLARGASEAGFRSWLDKVDVDGDGIITLAEYEAGFDLINPREWSENEVESSHVFFLIFKNIFTSLGFPSKRRLPSVAVM